MSEQDREFERNVAIREANHIHDADAYFKARPQIDNADRRKVFEAGHSRAWQAATLESAGRIAALESEVAELKEQLSILKPHPLCDTSCLLSCSMGADYAEKQYLENQQLKASNNILREALLASDDLLRELPNSGGFYGLAIMENNQLVLSATPAQSLQEFENEVIERVINLMEDMNADGKHTLPDYIEAIRALKGLQIYGQVVTNYD